MGVSGVSIDQINTALARVARRVAILAINQGRARRAEE
jgi:hypothetical protein